MWALQGRFQHRKIMFKKHAEYLRELQSQLLDFPNPMAHDDLIDALAYIDQVSNVVYYNDTITVDDYEPFDDVAGY